MTARGHGILRLPVGRMHLMAVGGGGVMRSWAAAEVRYAADTTPIATRGQPWRGA